MILVVHDGTTLADKAFEEGVRLAKVQEKNLHLLAVVPDSSHSLSANVPEGGPQDGNSAFARIGSQLGVSISDSCLHNPSKSKLVSFVETNDVCHVVMSSDQLVESSSYAGHLLEEFAKCCPVPVSIVP